MLRSRNQRGLETTFWSRSRSRSHSNWSWSRPRSQELMVSGLIRADLVTSKRSFVFLINLLTTRNNGSNYYR